MKYPHALLYIALLPYSRGQENDSLAIQLQSLRARVDSLESVVKQAQNNMFTSSDVENMFRSIDGNHHSTSGRLR